MDSHDNLHLVWQENVGTDDGVLYYSKGLAGDGGSITWTAPVSLSAIAPITDSARPALAIDAGDGLHLVWEDHVAPSQQYIYYAHSLDNSAVLTTPTRWSTPTLVMTRPAKANDTSPSYVSPAIAVAGQTVYVAWHDSTSDFNDQEEILYAFSTNQGASWSDPINVSQSAGVQSLFPQLVAEGGGIVHFVWQEKVNGTFVVRYTRTRWEIFLPLIMKNP
ncbi:MAG: exo-alpha-sialidase [Caldilineae bacterium]|nr:MAG: exo-alpha-sialidase [Caldilineae bacterium]